MPYPQGMQKVAIALAIVSTAGCTGAAAYGPSGDDRLDEATENVGTVQASGSLETAVLAIEATDCPRLSAALEEVMKENDEESKLAGLTGVLGRLQASNKTIQEVITERPGAAYFSGKTSDDSEHDLPVFIQACESSHIDAQHGLEAIIRDILVAPIVQEFTGKRRRAVKKARVDFDLLSNAIAVLAPVDEDLLMNEVREAKDRLPKKKPPRRKKGK